MIKNTPLGKGIGAKTIEELEKYAAKLGVSLYEAAHKAVQANKPENRDKHFDGAPPFNMPTGPLRDNAWHDGGADSLQAGAARGGACSTCCWSARATRNSSRTARRRAKSAGRTCWNCAPRPRSTPTCRTPRLAAFLEDVALMSDADTIKEEQDAVTLITLHAAKGLEYPVVFIVGMDEGILPHSRSLEDENQLEEERRLAYVGITRAKQRLYLVYACRRTLYGMTQNNGPSRFISDMPPELVTGRDPGTAFQPALFGGKSRRCPSAA